MPTASNIAGDLASFRFRTPEIDSDELRVTAFDGSEGLSELFDFRVQLCSKGDVLDPVQLIGRPATIEIDGEHGMRVIHGLVRRFELIEDGATVTSYEANLVPVHWLLTRRIQSRVFNAKRCRAMTVIDIVSKVLADAGLSPGDLVLATKGQFEAREFVVQYRESDWDFVSRLLEKEGIYYYFDHGPDGCRLVLTDDQAAHRPYAGHNDACVPYREANGMVAECEFIHQARVCSEIRIGRVALDDFDFGRPPHELRTEARSDRFANLGLIEWPGGFVDAKRGRRLAESRLQEQQCGTRVLSLAATVRGFWAGGRMSMTEHPVEAFNGEYLITRVTHRATQTQSAETDGFDAAGCRYEAEVRVIPAAVQFRPARVTPIPTVLGSQTAIVVGPPGEEIHTDEYGRVEVRFHWDLEGRHDVGASCWIRVSHGWAGGEYGMIFHPRVGQEVIVDFLEGDPDQPIITGRVYNRDHMPPYRLPEHKTVSTIKSRTSQGGGGANEIRFDDRAGDEEFFMNASRDLHTRVTRQQVSRIGCTRHTTVCGDDLEKIGKSRHSEVQLDLVQEVGGNISLRVAADVDQKIDGRHTTVVGSHYTLAGQSNVVIEAGTALTLKVGGNFIKIDSSGICILGKMVDINSGGSAGQGNALALKERKSPRAANRTEPGHDTNYNADAATLEAVNADALAGGKSAAAATAKQSSWIEIYQCDELGQPCAGKPYRLKLPDGTSRPGVLDQNGLAHERVPDPGMCQVTFPDLDAAAWERIG